MDRRTRTLLVVIVAVATASSATWLVLRAIRNLPVREVEVASQFVVVAAERMPVGTLLTRERVKLVPWPAASQVPGSHHSIDPVLNRGLIATVDANEPVTENKMAPIEAGAGLPPSIPAGMRAMSVRVNDVISVAGFAVPGTRVDVLVTVGRSNDSISRVVVTNVQVLAAGTLIDQQKARDGQPVPTAVVTLLLTPEDAERIALASSEGRLMLVLRNPLDTKPTETKGVRLRALMGEPDPPPVVRVEKGKPVVVRRPPPPPPPRIYSVEAIRAAKRTEEIVR
jgi:pilus assembly protein CpaB